MKLGWHSYICLTLGAGLISYSEATRFNQTKRLEAEAWCQQNNKPLPLHTLYPRSKGFIASVKNLRETKHIKAVYDVTVAYAKRMGDKYLFMQPPSFAQSLLRPGLGQDWKFYVHVDRHPLEQLPEDDSDLAQWLEDRWVEKGRRLESLRQGLVKDRPELTL